MSDQPDRPIEAEGVGETLGEAKWAALRELERLVPHLDRGAVEFVVVSEGERGLLGVGYVEARVLARVPVPPVAVASDVPPTDLATRAVVATGPAAILAEVVERICGGIGVDARVQASQTEEGLEAVVLGSDLGLLIGKHGATLDAIQYVATAVVSRRLGERAEVVVDAAGYRARRRRTLESLADRAAADALARSAPVALEPMSASERKIVHVRLAARADVETSSDGDDPNRHVVVRPAASTGD